MPNAAIVATALTTQQTRSVGLWIDGFDVIGVAGVTTWGTPVETIDLEEQGPDGVSSLTFVVEDFANAVPVNEGSVVRMQDFFADQPLFLGWVQSWDIEVLGLGRRITVQAIGVEAILDWDLVTSYVGVARPWDSFDTDIAAVITHAGFNIRIVQGHPTGGGFVSSLAAPIENLTNFQYDVSVSNTTLRETIRQVFAGEQTGAVATDYRCTVDFLGNLRVWEADARPSDYADFSISDTAGSGTASADLRHTSDATSTIHRVQVVGTGAGIGLVVDGSNVPGPIAILSDPMSTTAALRASIGAAYIANHQRMQSGQFRYETWQPFQQVRAGMTISITDAQIGLSGSVFEIKSIRKQFHPGGKQTWTVSYGSYPQRGSQAIRGLTRDILS